MKRTGCAAALSLCCSLVVAQETPWRLASGTAGVAIADVDIFLSNPDTMYAFGDLFLITTDRGEHWDTLPGPATDIGELRVDPINSRLIYVSHYGLDPDANDISISTDAGQTWEREFIGRGAPVPIVEIDPIDLRSAYVGVGPGMIFRTSDYGQTWELLAGPPASRLLDLVIAPSDNTILMAGNIAQVFKSTDRGATWTELSLGVQLQLGARFAIDPEDPNTIYAALFSFGLPPGGVYKSTDGGVTWSEKNNGLANDDWKILTIDINPARADEVFLGISSVTNRGLMRSTNAGETWEAFTNGLPDSTGVRSIVFDTTTSRMVISVGGLSSNGIYLMDSGTTHHGFDSPYQPAVTYLFPNYPNPFNGTTVIPFAVPHRTRLKLMVYSLLGAVVETLVDEEKEAGFYEFLFSSLELASGLYYVALEMPGFSQTRPIVLLK